MSCALAQCGFTDSDIESLLTFAQSSEVKGKLRETTERLVEAGGFGVPTMLIREEGKEEESLVFGSDRMHVVAMLLGKEWKEPLHMTQDKQRNADHRHSKL